MLRTREVRRLTDGGDAVVGGCLEDVARPGGADDLEGAGVGTHQQHPRSHVPLELQHSHRLQQSGVPETFLVSFKETLKEDDTRILKNVVL